MYDEELLTWVTYGNSGRILKRSGKFNIGRNNCGLRAKKEKINLDYIKYIAEPIFLQNVKGEKQKTLPQTVVKNISIPMPINLKGEFDLKAQEDIVEKYNLINELKEKINEYRENIKQLTVQINDEFEYSTKVKINKIFETQKGLSKYTKGYGNNNQGEYPVYSASNNAPLTYINTYDYDGEYLTWATNGFAGYIKKLSGKFSANGDRGILIPKEKNIDILYIKFTLEPILRQLAKGRKGDKGKDEFTKVYPSMVEDVEIDIPLNKNSEFDLKTQEEIANKYQKIEDIKLAINKELEKIENLTLEY